MYKICMFPGLVKATQLNDLLIYAEAQLVNACAEWSLELTAELRVHLFQRGWPPKDRDLGFPSPFKDAPELLPPLLRGCHCELSIIAPKRITHVNKKGHSKGVTCELGASWQR